MATICQVFWPSQNKFVIFANIFPLFFCEKGLLKYAVYFWYNKE